MNDESHPVLTCAQAVELEKGLLQGDEKLEWQAMTRAGVALGEALLKDFLEIGVWPARPRLLILAGKGHNSGDAFIAVRHLLKAHPRAAVDVLFAMGEEALNPLARRAWSDLLDAAGAGERSSIKPFSLDRRRPMVPQLEETCRGPYHLCLDGLFGMNFRPPFRQPLDEVVGWINDELDARMRAAVDLPSGLSDEPSDLAFKADFSYMTGSAKQPLFDPANAQWTGRLRYLDIGFFAPERGQNDNRAPEVPDSRSVLLPTILSPLRRLRDPMLHKRKLGHLMIVGGSMSMPGAILMCAMAAARSGVGLVTAAVPAPLVPGFATVVPEVMWIPCSTTNEGGLDLDSLSAIERGVPGATAVLLGPGVGTEPETQALLEEVVRKIKAPLVLDAQALQPKVVDRLRSRGEMRGRTVVTPHAGEFARMFGRDFSEGGEQALLELCRESGFLVLLKGPPFTRFCDGASIGYGLAGGPVLARGGSGDILTGMIGSQVARCPDQVASAVRRSIVWHGLAGEAVAREYGHEAVRTTQLLDALPRVLREDERNG